MKRTLTLALAALLALTACGAPGGEVSADTPAPSEAVSPSPETPEPDASPSTVSVYTDWSALEPYEPTELIFRRWYEEPVHALRPLEGGYGTLVPFVGSFPPNMHWGGVYEYGLMTMDGTIVVDTAYSDVYPLTFFGAEEETRLPVLVLMTTPELTPEVEWRHGEQRFGAAALDGSWAIPTEYNGIRVFSPEGFFLWDKDTVYVYHADGQLLHSIPYANTARLEEFYGGVKLDEGILTELEGTTLRLIDLETGKITYVGGISDMTWPGDGLFPVCSADSGLWGCVDKAGQWVISPKYGYISIFWDGLAEAYTGGTCLYIDREGNEYAEDPREPQESPPQESPPEGTDPIEDGYTGEVYFSRSLGGLFDGCQIEDREGNVLGFTTAMGYASEKACVVNGLFLNIDGETAGYKDADGNWVFRILLAEAGD